MSKEILLSGLSQTIQEAKFTYSPVGNTFNKQKWLRVKETHK